MTKSAVIIGATNRSITGLNNTLCLSPAYICKRTDVDEIVAAINGAMTRTMAAH
jgi:taurine-pyruvate aminotransferase